MQGQDTDALGISGSRERDDGGRPGDHIPRKRTPDRIVYPSPPEVCKRCIGLTDGKHFPNALGKAERYGLLDLKRGVTLNPITGKTTIVPELPQGIKEPLQPAAQPQQS